MTEPGYDEMENKNEETPEEAPQQDLAAQLGASIRDARSKLGISQGELALRADLTQSAVSLYETGVRYPRIPALYAIAEAIGVHPGVLLP